MATTGAAKKQTAKKPAADFQQAFDALKEILKPYEKQCHVHSDLPSIYSLYTAKKIWKGERVYFATVQKRKNYVSFYLMTVYGSPAEQKKVSPELKKRMQGKACFNFTSIDPGLMEQLAALVRSGAKRFLEVDQLDTTGARCD